MPTPKETFDTATQPQFVIAVEGRKGHKHVRRIPIISGYLPESQPDSTLQPNSLSDFLKTPGVVFEGTRPRDRKRKQVFS